MSSPNSETDGALAAASHELPAGRVLEIAPGTGDAAAEGRLVLRAPDGTVELEILVTEAGPVLRARTLAIETSEELHLRSKRVSIEGSERVDVRSNGKIRVDADGPVESVGHSNEIRARAGNVELKANDDVRAQGERVRLNC